MNADKLARSMGITPAMRAGIAAHEAAEQWLHGNTDDAEYSAFLGRVNTRFALTTAGRPVFRSTANPWLWKAYIDAFPLALRQHHNCNACRKFIEDFGDLVVINEDGTVTSALWHEDDAHEPYKRAVASMRLQVEIGKATGQFLSNEKMFGQPKTGKWQHLHAANVARYTHPIKSAYAAMAEKREEFGMVWRALVEWHPTIVKAALALLEGDALYRAEKVIGPVRWLHDLMELRGMQHEHRHNLIWRAVATAPASFARVRSSVAASLLDDLAARKPLEEVRRAFAAKMRPDTYQRPQAAPKAGTIAAAERAFADMGLARSLDRRFARLDEITAVWAPPPLRATTPQGEATLFGHLQPKQPTQAAKAKLPAKTMTWEKFVRTALPEAISIEFFAPALGPYAALATAVHADAPPILQWDSDERRNPFSWYLYTRPSHASNWNVRAGEFVKVTAITLKPSMWQPGFEHHGQGVLLVLDRCKDTRDPSNALFPETLKSDLHPYRAVIEAFSRSKSMIGRQQASACGFMLQGDQKWNARLRVTTHDTVREITLDRWD